MTHLTRGCGLSIEEMSDLARKALPDDSSASLEKAQAWPDDNNGEASSDKVAAGKHGALYCQDWSCSVCTLNNIADAAICSACESARPPQEGSAASSAMHIAAPAVWSCPACTLNNT